MNFVICWDEYQRSEGEGQKKEERGSRTGNIFARLGHPTPQVTIQGHLCMKLGGECETTRTPVPGRSPSPHPTTWVEDGELLMTLLRVATCRTCSFPVWWTPIEYLS